MAVSTIQVLQLQNFRCFANSVFSFDAKQTLIIGRNGAGKTNILEALALLSTGSSFRTHTLSECVKLGCEVAHIAAKALIDAEEEQLQASIVSKHSELHTRASSRFQRNGVKKRKSEVVGVLKSVVFRPEDVEIITGSPSVKRDFLDSVLVQVSPKYYQALREYERAVKHRNKLILQLREGTVTRRDFVFWDQLLITHGDVLTRERARFIHFVNTYVNFPIKGEMQYDSSLMTEERLHQYAVAEVAAGKTLVGPHRDSLQVLQELQQGEPLADVADFGSRGQQRMAILWLKLASLAFIEQETRINPILLLDDVFSELDEQNREILFPLFENHQVILTSAEELEMLPEQVKAGQTIAI